MKNKKWVILLIGILLLTVVSNLKKQNQVSNLNRDKQNQKYTNSLGKPDKSILQNKEIIENALIKVKGIEEFQNDLKHLSDLEIVENQKEIQKYLEKNDLFKKANTNQLNEKLAIELVNLMRKNQALCLIQLDRKMKKFERKYL